MATLHNRLCKAEFYLDPDLLGLPLDVRRFYRDLWHVAEDSGCLEDSPFGWKIALFPSPLDADVTVERITEWRDALVGAGKLTPYMVDGRPYLFLTNFLRHQTLTNPKRSQVPLPPWVQLVEHPTDNRKRSYKVTGSVPRAFCEHSAPLDQPLGEASATVAQALSNDTSTPEQGLSKSRTEPNRIEEKGLTHMSAAEASDECDCTALEVIEPSEESAGANRPPSDDGFDAFWSTYPRREGDKAKARSRWRRMTLEKRRLATGVATVMRDLYERGAGPEKRFIPTIPVFLNGERWEDWREGPPAGWSPQGDERDDLDAFMRRYAAERGMTYEPV